MNNTIKIAVIKYLEANHETNWCWAGIISRAVHEETGHKESVIERHGLRKLREAGILEVNYAQVDGSGPKCSRYRVKPLESTQNSPNLCKPIKPDLFRDMGLQDEIQEDTTSMEKKLTALTLL